MATGLGKDPTSPTKQLAGLHISRSPEPEARPPQPPRPIPPPEEDEEDDFVEEDENDPFADRNAVVTPKVERAEPSWYVDLLKTRDNTLTDLMYRRVV